MPLILPGNVATATAPTTYSVANSCRFNDGDSAYLSKTLGTPTDVDKWTVSYWIKRGVLGNDANVFGAGTASSNEEKAAYFKTSSNTDQFYWQQYISSSTSGQLKTTQLFRDPAAWYHFVLTYDSGNATSGNRLRMYVNGTEITAFDSETQPSADTDSLINSAIAHTIGCDQAIASFFDGYMAEFLFFDGQAYAPSDVGEFDEDSPSIWKPKDPSGLTFGDNGFWLDFEDSSALGNDVSGNNNDWTANNLAAADQCTDSPTNNFCTMSPLVRDNTTPIFSEGNLLIANNNNDNWSDGFVGTIALSAGKWYWEVKVTAGNDDFSQPGISDIDFIGHHMGGASVNNYSQTWTNLVQGAAAHTTIYNGTETQYNSNLAWQTANIAMFALDMDNRKMWFGVDGTWSNDDSDTIGVPADGTYPTFTANDVYANTMWIPSLHGYYDATTGMNFGGCPPFTISSAVADGNGYGAFEYTPPSGFLAICTKNLGSDGG